MIALQIVIIFQTIINYYWNVIIAVAERPIVWDCMKMETTKSPCDAKKTRFRYPTFRPEPYHVTISDRISLVGWKYLAELTYLDNPMNDVVDFYNPIDCFLTCLKPFTTVWVDNNVIPLFMRKIVPLLTVPIILLSGDGDHSTPHDSIMELLAVSKTLEGYKKNISHWYGHNCRPLGPTLESWITCLPIGLSYVTDNIHRNLLHHALNIRYGNYGKLLTNYIVDNSRLDDKIQQAKEQSNSVLVSFKVGRLQRKTAREPVVNYFCSSSDGIPGPAAVSPFRSMGGEAFCGEFPHVQYHMNLSRFRFVASPSGYGRDCYRTWETLFMGSYPIVLASAIQDTVYDGLPVLILNNWTQATPTLLNDTYHRFMAQNWSLDKLYFTYWEKEIYSRRERVGGSGDRWQYYFV